MISYPIWRGPIQGHSKGREFSGSSFAQGIVSNIGAATQGVVGTVSIKAVDAAVIIIIDTIVAYFLCIRGKRQATTAKNQQEKDTSHRSELGC